MLKEAFNITSVGILQSFILGLIGFIIVKKNVLGEQGLYALSRLVIEITLPVLIFYKIIQDFNFTSYPNWWIFPVVSILITCLGLALGLILEGVFKQEDKKRQFIGLLAFQNSGYLPLVLIASLVPQAYLSTMLIYLFLFLLGFNLVMFSWGVHFLTADRGKKFNWAKLFNPPVVATLIGLILVFFNLKNFVPEVVMKPLKMMGDCTLPLANLIVGGNIASIHFSKVDKKAMVLMSVVKLILMPLLGVGIVFVFKLPALIGLLIVLQLAMPPATNLSVILTQYKKEDLIISEGIFFGHIISIVTIPLFLSLYFSINMIK